jgi:hypothetical protein
MTTSARNLPVDRFHIGVRLASLLWWVVATALIYLTGVLLFSAVLGDAASWVWLPWLIAALLLSQLWGKWGEQQLMRLWPSGRAVQLQPVRLILNEKTGSQTFELAHKVNFWRWRFQIKDRRGGRVPGGHFCCALRLAQDDGGATANASLYAFLPPQRAEALKARFPFHELRPSKETNLQTPHFSGKETTFLSAEKARWENGAELEPDDFEAVLEHLNAHVPEFGAGETS